MRIEEKFTVAASADAVWAFLTDPQRVAGALPGAEITEQIDENTYKGGMSVKVGPLGGRPTTAPSPSNWTKKREVGRGAREGAGEGRDG